MMQVSQTVWRLFTHGPDSRMKLPPRSSANETWRGWWISPTQCPRYLSDASFAASLFDVGKTSKSAGMAVKRHLGTPGHWLTVIVWTGRATLMKCSSARLRDDRATYTRPWTSRRLGPGGSVG